jgi:hypothetical protein
MTAEYTYSEARQKLASLLEQAAREGEVRIPRQDGTIFSIRLAPEQGSPLDVEGVALGLGRDEIIALIGEGRRYEEDGVARGPS